MKPTPKPAPPQREGWPTRLFVTLFGVFLGLAVLKFGNPPNMEEFVTAPADVWEFILASPWPIAWAYWLLGGLAVLGLFTARWKLDAPPWIVALPLAWLVWQLFAASDSMDPRLSTGIVVHFATCALCFYLGLFALGRARCIAWLWLGITFAFLSVLAIGWQQHFGGLAETRRYFYANIYPTLTRPMPPEYVKRLNSTRIFSTLFYPNTLAGALLLLLPPILTAAASTRRLTRSARAFVVLVLGLGGLGCLCWSGSKGGWLLMLVLGVVALLRLPLGKRLRLGIVGAVLGVGLAGFVWQFAGFLKRGAPSVSARFDYWQAAARITKAHPLLGAGPGGFGSAYRAIKRPESEPSKLTHNDYLEQACDSGLPGFAAYTLFILGALCWSAPGRRLAQARLPAHGALGGLMTWLKGLWPADPASVSGEAAAALARERLRFAVWLGVLGWCLQGLFEFGLYIPAVAWPAFTLLGWLLGLERPLSSAASGPTPVASSSR